MTGSKPAALPLGYTPAEKLKCKLHATILLDEIYKEFSKKVAGVRGFEPLNDGIKTRCLTAWLYPCNVTYFATNVALKWYGVRDLNSHILRYWNLNPARLPIPPTPHFKNGGYTGTRTWDPIIMSDVL